MIAVDRIIVNVLVDNTVDMLCTRPDHITSELSVLMENGMDEMAGEALCCAQHGLSLGVTAEAGGSVCTVLFDAGPEGGTLERNAARTGFDFGCVDAVALSHGHFDHSQGLLRAAELVRKANGSARVPLHVHPGSFVKRADRLPDGRVLPLQDVHSREALREAGFELVECDHAEDLLGGIFYLSGEIPRRSFERGLENQVARNAAGEWEPDPWVMEERFLAAQVRDKGLVIVTGCSHAGIVNICAHARECFPGVPIYGVIGGLHLVFPNEAFIDETIAALREFGVQRVIPGHCTGWRATHALLNAFGSDAVDPMAVGSRITLE